MTIVLLCVVGVFIALFLEERAGILQPGQSIPDVTLSRVSGERVRLRDYLANGPVILIFYPKDFTTGCTQQVCAFRDSYAQFTRVGATVLGVSGDSSASHTKFSRTYGLPFELLTDPDGSVRRAFGVQRFGGLVPFAKRVTFVIGRDGVILRSIHHELFMGQHVEDALGALGGP